MEKTLENKKIRVGKKAEAQDSIYAERRVTYNIFQRAFIYYFAFGRAKV